MEEIKCENPNLSVGAQQQMALRRCSKPNEEEQEEGRVKPRRRFTTSDALLRGFMTKLHLGDHDDSTTQATHFTGTAEGGGTSFNPCKSVILSSQHQNKMSAFENWDETDSLEHSLEDIEKSVRVQSNINTSTRYGRRPSGLSLGQLSEVGDEYEDSKESDTEEGGSPNHDITSKKSNPSTKTIGQESISDFVPNEIALVLEYFDSFHDKEEGVKTPSQERRKSGRVRHHQHSFKSSIKFRKSILSHCDSFTSIDSANFNGDFSAWHVGEKSPICEDTTCKVGPSVQTAGVTQNEPYQLDSNSSKYESIENSFVRYSRRSSGLSSDQLSDVEEAAGESFKDSDTEEEGSKNNNPSINKEDQESIHHLLPDEIALVPVNFGSHDEKKEAVYHKEPRRGQGKRHYQHSIKSSASSRRSNASHDSSFVSVDNTNFSGDFWAWRSVSSESTHST